MSPFTDVSIAPQAPERRSHWTRWRVWPRLPTTSPTRSSSIARLCFADDDLVEGVRDLARDAAAVAREPHREIAVAHGHERAQQLGRVDVGLGRTRAAERAADDGLARFHWGHSEGWGEPRGAPYKDWLHPGRRPGTTRHGQEASVAPLAAARLALPGRFRFLDSAFQILECRTEHTPGGPRLPRPNPAARRRKLQRPCHHGRGAKESRRGHRSCPSGRRNDAEPIGIDRYRSGVDQE